MWSNGYSQNFPKDLRNTTETELDYSCIGVLSNAWFGEKASNRVTKNGKLTQLVVRNDGGNEALETGEIALSTDTVESSVQDGILHSHISVKSGDILLFRG